jgi:hypothetical protein
VPLAVRDGPDRHFWSLVEANFAEKGAWERLSNLAATPMDIEIGISNLP